MATRAGEKRILYGPFAGSGAPAPPGNVLAEELTARGMTQSDLAKAMKRPLKAVNEIVRGKKAITPDSALDLEAALGISATFWLNLEQAYRLAQARLRRNPLP